MFISNILQSRTILRPVPCSENCFHFYFASKLCTTNSLSLNPVTSRCIANCVTVPNKVSIAFANITTVTVSECTRKVNLLFALVYQRYDYRLIIDPRFTPVNEWPWTMWNLWQQVNGRISQTLALRNAGNVDSRVNFSSEAGNSLDRFQRRGTGLSRPLVKHNLI